MSWASSPAVRRSMLGNRSRDTRPELAVRSAAHRLGLRFRVCARPVPGSRRTADILFTRRRLAVLVDGCFWHACPEHWRQPKANAAYWTAKAEGNAARDRDTDRLLAEAGWRVLRVWEHESPAAAALRIAAAVG